MNQTEEKAVTCRTSNLAARMVWRTVFGRKSILGGWWFGVVWTGWSYIFPKHPIRQVSVLLTSNHPFLLIILVLNLEAWNWINSVPQRAATTFAFSSVKFFFFGNILLTRIYNVFGTLKEHRYIFEMKFARYGSSTNIK